MGDAGPHDVVIVLLFTGTQSPSLIQNRMLFEMITPGCLQFHLAI